MIGRVLVVDDLPDVRSAIGNVLTDAGYAVQLAANEAQALTAIVEETFDFAVIDVRLHGDDEDDESGLSLAVAIRHLDSRVRIILMTGFAVKSQQIVRAVRLYGAVAFVTKSSDVGELILDAVKGADEECQRSNLENIQDGTRLCISLTGGQPLVIRSHGSHVCAARTWTVLRVDLERYARRTELARKDVEYMRFQVAEIGTKLWGDVFSDHPEAGAVFFEARGKGQPLSFLFETPREFLRLPLEFMRSDSPAEYLVLRHPLSRLVYDAIPRNEALSPKKLARMRKLHVLLIASNTKPPIPGVDAEIQELEDFWRNQDTFPTEVTALRTEQAAYERVREELKSPSFDIVHYAGHGFFDAASPEDSYLCFWSGLNKQGPIKRIRATELKLLLDQSNVRLLYLSSCYGSASGGESALLDDDFLGLADAAVQAGIPSVLGFRWPASDARAPKLALAFYQALLKCGSPEAALWSARCELAASDREEPTWLSPILIHQE
jgi:ActR/RegA family two-component response regulator